MPTKGEVREDGRTFYRFRRKMLRDGVTVRVYEVWVTKTRWDDLESKRLRRNAARVLKYQESEAYRTQFKSRIKAYHDVDYRRRMLIMARSRNKHEGIPFNLQLSDIPFPTHCPALGIKLEKGDRWAAPSLDKIIPVLGYVKGNVAVVSMLANLIKCHAAPDQILAVGRYYKKLCR